MNRRYPLAASCLLLSLLAGCGASSTAPDTGSSVAVTTVRPVQRTFHDSIAAWGRAVADSSHLQRLNLAHAGRVRELPVTAGQAVHKGQALLRMVTDPTARQAYLQAEHALALARGNLARTRQLAAQHLATREQLAAARKALDDASAALQAQRDLGDGQAEYTLRAPADGVVTALHVGRGDRVAADAPLMDFAPSRGLVALLGVQPELAGRIRVGMPVRLSAVYASHDSVLGRIDMVGHAIDPGNGLVPVRASIPAATAATWVAGNPVVGRIHTTEFTAWAVPRGAVLDDARGHYLFQASHGHARRVNVEVLQPDGDVLGVHGKLDPHLPVIVTGAYELADGDAVRQAGS